MATSMWGVAVAERVILAQRDQRRDRLAGPRLLICTACEGKCVVAVVRAGMHPDFLVSELCRVCDGYGDLLWRLNLR